MVFAPCDPHAISGLFLFSTLFSLQCKAFGCPLAHCVHARSALKHPDSTLLFAFGCSSESPCGARAGKMAARLACPICRKQQAGRACGNKVFARASCPVCLETSEPVVALPCGHAVCEPCFGRLPGGALLVDGTASGSSTATATATLQWRESMAVGDVIDAKDSEGRWFDSRIVAIDVGDRVRVHYNGWSSRWDSWVDRNDESIQPHLTHTDDWRRLRVGDELEMRGPGEKALWYKSFVKEVDGSRVLVSSHTPNVGEQWLETSSELICKLGSHTRPVR